MKKLFILLGLLMFSILGCSCERIKVPEETRVLGGCVYVEKKEFRECSQPGMPKNNYVGFIFEKKEYDVDNVNVTAFFGIKESEFIHKYNYEHRQLERPHTLVEINEIVDYNIYVYFFHSRENLNGKVDVENIELLQYENGIYIIDQIKFTSIEMFPFENYSFNRVQIEDDRYEYKYIYANTYNIILPKELFIQNEGMIWFRSSEYIYFEDGSKRVTSDAYECFGKGYFYYKKEGNKVIIWN